jgi:hypothetical protein
MYQKLTNNTISEPINASLIPSTFITNTEYYAHSKLHIEGDKRASGGKAE